ncbi:hypothetical protein C9J21_01255 [Photobacterium phosphoreum]|nr:hypothetical protein C9J21_01255 [Photobacterium phosphoreum]
MHVMVNNFIIISVVMFFCLSKQAPRLFHIATEISNHLSLFHQNYTANINDNYIHLYLHYKFAFITVQNNNHSH